MLLPLALCLLSLQDVRTVAPRPPQPAGETVSTQDKQAALLADLRRRNIEVEFTGGTVFSSEELLKILSGDEQAADYFRDGVGAKKFDGGDRNYEKLDIALKLLRNRLAARGYLQVKIEEPRLESGAYGRRITIRVSEGARYRIGEIKFEGAKLFTPEELSRRFPLKTGDVASGETIYDFFFNQLKRSYGERGHVQYSADPEPTFHPPSDGAGEGVVDYLVTIDEGRCFILDSVEFTGNASTPERLLRQAVPLRAGEPFNVALIDQGIKNLDALNLFERIDPARDIDFRLDEESIGIQVKIKLKEKQQP